MYRKNWKSLMELGNGFYGKRVLSIVVLVAIALVLTAFGLFAQLNVEVTVILDGEEQQVKTQSKTVEELFQELEVTYSTHDHIQPELHTPLTAGMQVEWKKAVEVQLDLYGQGQKIWTTAETVAELISEQKLTFQEGDVLAPEPQEAVRESMRIEITHLEEQIIEEEQVFSYQTIRKNDDALLQGEQKIVTKGKDGKALHKIKITYKNGQELHREFVSSEVLEERRDEVIAVGTKTTVARGSYVFAPRQVLDNVTLTAYSAGVEHTGKTPDHPQYALTRSGTRVTDGKTIAVDPKLIPLGTWVYIEDLGLRLAEDTGGAVRGKKIDVYYEDNDTAKKFGTKKGYKVYVIGKQKPSSTK